MLSGLGMLRGVGGCLSDQVVHRRLGGGGGGTLSTTVNVGVGSCGVGSRNQ